MQWVILLSYMSTCTSKVSIWVHKACLLMHAWIIGANFDLLTRQYSVYVNKTIIMAVL